MTADQWHALGKVLEAIGPTSAPFLLAWVFKPHIRAWVLKVLDENRPYLRRIIDEEYAVSIKERDEALAIIAEHSDKVEYLEKVSELQGSRLTVVEKETRDLPRFTTIVGELTTAIKEMTGEFGEMRVTVARIDERQRMAWPDIEQRHGTGRRKEDER